MGLCLDVILIKTLEGKCSYIQNIFLEPTC